jgi:hypothetical protein
MGCSGFRDRYLRTNRAEHLPPIYGAPWQIQSRVVQPGSRHGRRSTSLCALLHRGPVGTHHNSAAFSAYPVSSGRTRRSLCASVVASLLLNIETSLHVVARLHRSVECGESFARSHLYPFSPRPQTSALWTLSSSSPSQDIKIGSRPRPDGFSDVVVSSTNRNMSITLDPVCTFSLMYPEAK